MLKAVLSRKNLSENDEFYECIRDLLENQSVEHLKDFSHHLGTSRFQHCLNVSYYNFLVCRKLGLDAKAGPRAGLLHDFFFYNRRDCKKANIKGFHVSVHPMIAFTNAAELFPISELESDMIVCHMWPITKNFPRHRETFVITFVDKFCAVAEIASTAVNRARKRV